MDQDRAAPSILQLQVVIRGISPPIRRRLQVSSNTAIADDGAETRRGVATLERADLSPATLGLSLEEGKAILKSLQEVAVEWQLGDHLCRQRIRPFRVRTRRSKGSHPMTLRTVVNPVISKRTVKRQQMQWGQRGARLLLVRTRVRRVPRARARRGGRRRRCGHPANKRAAGVESDGTVEGPDSSPAVPDAHAGRLHIHRVKGSVSGVYPIQPEDLRRVQAYLNTRRDDSPYMRYTTATRDSQTRRLFSSPLIV